MSSESWDLDVLKIAEELENAALPQIHGWEAIPWELYQEPKTIPEGVKKSRDWKPTPLGAIVSPSAAWYRTTFIVPEKTAGIGVAGQLSLYLKSNQSHFYIFVDGQYAGYIEMNDETVLARDVKPGDRLDILMYGDEMKNFPMLLDARFRADAEREYLERIQDCAFSLRVGVQILRADTKRRGLYFSQESGENNFPEKPERLDRLRGQLLQAATLFDLEALRAHDRAGFSASMERAIDAMKPVDEFAKEWNFFCIGHSHLDLAWKWRWAESIECGRETIRWQIENMKKHPGYVFVESSPALWEEIKQRDPALFAEMQEMARRGQFEPVGGAWCENDTITISEESWARHFLYTEKFTRENFGVEQASGFDIDCFGFTPSMPQLFSSAGIGAYLTQKLRYNDTNIFPYILFRWPSRDGSEILGIHVVPDHYQEIYAEEMAITVKEFGAATGIKDIPLLFGVGNHGGGPLPGMFQRLDRFAKLPIFPKWQFSSLKGYIEHLKKNWDLSKLPVLNDEMYLEAHRMTYTTQDQAKRGNRALETHLTNTEKLMAVAALEGLQLPQDGLAAAWKKVLLNQFHDILPGTSINSVYQDMREDYAAATEQGQLLQEKAVRHLARKIDSTRLPKGLPLLVFNTLAWKRDGFVEVELTRDILEKLARKGEAWFDVLEEAVSGKVCVLDASGRQIPCQLVEEGKARKMIFRVEAAPAMGYRVYILARKKRSARTPEDCKATKHTLENPFLRVEVDPKTGYVKRILDKTTQREVVAKGAQANEIQMLEGKPKRFASWNLGYTGREFRVPLADSVEIVEKGPIRSVLRVKRSFTGETKKQFYTSYFWLTPACDYPSSFFEQDIILYHNSNQVDFRLNVDWWEDYLFLKTAFPLNLDSHTITVETAYSHWDRTTRPQTPVEKARFEGYTLKWADLWDDGYGATLLNKCKHGYDAKDSTIRLSLLTSPKDPSPHSCPDPMVDRGKHTIDYALYPHAGHWRDAGSVRRAWEYNTPFLCFPIERAKGEWSSERSWLEVEQENVVVTALKPALEGDGLIVRAFETAGKETSVRLALADGPFAARAVNLVERSEPSAEGVSLDSWRIGPWKTASLRLSKT